jgi:predicted TIM-barrel fold metal-dependent hydrolase
MDGVLDQTQRAREMFPDREFRAEVFWDAAKDNGRDLGELHRLGIRCLRLHGEFGNGQDSLDRTLESLQRLRNIASRHGWAVAAQLPITTWIALAPKLGLLDTTVEAESGSIIIAEHFGSPAQLPHTPEQSADFNVFVDYLSRSPLFYVKLSALHRRVSSAAKVEDLIPMIVKLAERAPNALLYGSDFPHVNVEVQSKELTPHLKVDCREEYRVLQSAISPDVLHKMLVTNPDRIFK